MASGRLIRRAPCFRFGTSRPPARYVTARRAVRRTSLKTKAATTPPVKLSPPCCLFRLQATRVRLAAVCAVTFGTATRLFEGRGRVMWEGLKPSADFWSTAKKVSGALFSDGV